MRNGNSIGVDRLYYSTTLTYCEIEHAQWQQHMALVGVVGEIARFAVFIDCSKRIEANRR